MLSFFSNKGSRKLESQGDATLAKNVNVDNIILVTRRWREPSPPTCWRGEVSKATNRGLAPLGGLKRQPSDAQSCSQTLAGPGGWNSSTWQYAQKREGTGASQLPANTEQRV